MVGVLAEDDHLHLVERRAVEGVEDEASGRVAGVLLTLGDEELLEVGEIGCLELLFQHGVPTVIYLDRHKVLKDLKDTKDLKDFSLKRNCISSLCRFARGCRGRGGRCSRRGG